MNRMITIALLGAVLSTPALAAGSSGNVGINVSFDNAVGIQGEFNLQKPLSLQVFLKNYSRTYWYGGPGGSYSYSYTAIGAAGIYDFSKELKITNKKVHPYAGLGLFTVSSSFSGSGAYVSSSVLGGIYLTAGARYEITPDIDLDGNYNNFGGLTIGANFKF
jgi:hypothetical protein